MLYWWCIRSSLTFKFMVKGKGESVESKRERIHKKKQNDDVDEIKYFMSTKFAFYPFQWKKISSLYRHRFIFRAMCM